jgi:predicted kinase
MHTSYIVCGSPGSGKTTYARQLAAARHAILLDIDTVTERLVRIALAQSGHSQDDRDSEHFKRIFREPIYETLFDVARENLQFQDAVIVGPFTKEIKDPHWPAALYHSLGSLIKVHYIQCQQEARKQRLARRGNARDLAKLHDWENYTQYYGNENPPVFEHVLVDGTTPEEWSAKFYD